MSDIVEFKSNDLSNYLLYQLSYPIARHDISVPPVDMFFFAFQILFFFAKIRLALSLIKCVKFEV